MTQFRGFQAVRKVAVPRRGYLPEEQVTLLQTSTGSPLVVADVTVKPIKISANGFPFLNRFIGMEDNAEMTLALTKALLREGKVVVFPEYIHGITAFDNVFTRIGPSASSLAVQLILFVLLAFYTFSKRFGQPTEERTPAPGAVDFVSASAEILKSARATDVVLETALQDSLKTLTRIYGIPVDLSVEEKIRRLPPSVRASLEAIHHRASAKPRVEETIRLLTDLEKALEDLQAKGRWTAP